MLEAIGEIVGRMAELGPGGGWVKILPTLNYSKEFLELQDQLSRMESSEKFNGVELFAVDEEWDDMQGVNKDQLLINGGAMLPYQVTGQLLMRRM